jgi:3-hydroxyacyl-[acyl-carrier-protein] dehydratase
MYRKAIESCDCGGILGDAMSESNETAVLTVAEPEKVDTPAEKTTMDIVEIMAILPHRYPFLLIDRVVEMERKTRIVAIKNVTMNEPHFTGHFPDYPIMPGVLQVEAMAQTGGALLLTEFSAEERADKLMVFTGIEEARFRRPVTPGDQLRIEVKVVNWRSRAVKMSGVITVEGKVVSDAIITCQLVPRVRKPKVEATSPIEGAAE